MAAKNIDLRERIKIAVEDIQLEEQITEIAFGLAQEANIADSSFVDPYLFVEEALMNIGSNLVKLPKDIN